ncbi:MAG: dihydropteroate synthase [Cyanobacteriota bacterium]
MISDKIILNYVVKFEKNVENMNKYKVRKLFYKSIETELLSIDFDKIYLPKAIDKYNFNLIKIHSLKAPAANILKQTALSKGGDLAVSTDVVTCKRDLTDAILAVTDKQLKLIIDSLKQQPFGLKKLSSELEEFLINKLSLSRPLIINNKEFLWGSKTHLMGILNITPDSFSDGGEYLCIDNAVKCVSEMIKNNVDIIDIGGESTRPFSEPVEPDIQIKRIKPIIKEIRAQFPDTVISVDTRSNIVANCAIEIGASIINDVSGLTFDSEMVSVVASNNIPLIIMHSQGTPETMQNMPAYNNLLDDICSFLFDQIDYAITHGVKESNIIIDPGIGFGKTINNNLEIIQRISEIKSLGYPTLVGTSRKNFIGKLLNEEVYNREEGTLATNAYLVSQGVDILRIHDISYHAKAIKMLDHISRTNF